MKLDSNKYITLFYSYTIVLILISVLPINSSGSVINHTFVVSIPLDYLLHCVIFIPWEYLLQRASSFNNRGFSKKTLILVLMGVLFACAMEGIQYVLPYRAFNVNDLLANGLGILLGFILIILGLFIPHRKNLLRV